MNAWRPRVFEMFLEPTCPFSVRAFGKLKDLLDKASEDRITVPKVRLQSAVLARLLGRDRALHFGRLDPRRRKDGREIRHGGGGRASQGIRIQPPSQRAEPRCH